MCIVKLNAIVRHEAAGGTFVWWSDDRLPNVPYLRVQMKSDALDMAATPIQMNTTSSPWSSGMQIRWQDVKPTLESFTARWTNVHKNSEDTTAEFRIPGNVRGIFLRGIHRGTFRIIVPIMEDGQEVPLNYTFVEWTTVNIVRLKLTVPIVHLNDI